MRSIAATLITALATTGALWADDLTVDRAVDEALVASTAVQAAAARAEAGVARSKQAKGHRWGRLDLAETFSYTNNPAEVLQVGDKVKVSILKIDQEQKRLALSIKRLQPDPWTLIDEHYRVGQLVEVTVTKITKFGAFAKLDDDYGLVGLIHISELSENHVENPNEVLKPSQKLMVRIIRIDTEQRQLGLSLKQVTSDKFIEADMEMLSASSN